MFLSWISVPGFRPMSQRRTDGGRFRPRLEALEQREVMSATAFPFGGPRPPVSRVPPQQAAPLRYFDMPVLTEPEVLKPGSSAQELHFATDGPIVAQALFQRLAPRPPAVNPPPLAVWDPLEINPGSTPPGVWAGTAPQANGPGGSVDNDDLEVVFCAASTSPLGGQTTGTGMQPPVLANIGGLVGLSEDELWEKIRQYQDRIRQLEAEGADDAGELKEQRELLGKALDALLDLLHGR